MDVSPLSLSKDAWTQADVSQMLRKGNKGDLFFEKKGDVFFMCSVLL